VVLFICSMVGPASSQTAPTMSQTDRVQFGRDTLAPALELLRARCKRIGRRRGPDSVFQTVSINSVFRFYLRLTEATVWLDDVRLAPALKTQR